MATVAPPHSPPPDEVAGAIAELARTAEGAARRELLRRRTVLHHPDAVSAIYDQVVALIRVDLERAGRLGHAARWLANRLRDDYCRAQALRATGHVLYARGRYLQALDRYETALDLLRRLDRDLDVGRTLSGALHTLIYLGRYDQALAWAEEARAIFARYGDRLRLARLDSNSANILYRQDRFDEALALYRRAYQEFAAAGGEPADFAAVLSNMAVCSISANDFNQALRFYREAREHCARHGMPLLVAEADYNIAYLHFLRGEYALAIELYHAARRNCRELDDRYHQALCDLDESEMYLELNLSEDGEELAQRALGQFRQLGLGYEAAKATAFLALAASHQGNTARALDLFRQARTLFLGERNRIWPALIDLYQALVLAREGAGLRARKFARAAFRFFSNSPLTAKAAACELLLARLDLAEGDLSSALRAGRSALERAEKAESPKLSCQVWFLLGQIHEAAGEADAAREAYRNAHARLESLRSHLGGEELKIAFLKDKLAVYESLVWMCLDPASGPPDPDCAFGFIEQSKSRSLADLIAFRAQGLPAASPNAGELAAAVRRLREELNWCCRQIQLQESREVQPSPVYLAGLRERAREYETRLAEAFERLRSTDQEFTALQNAGTIGLEEIRGAIPAGTLLVEYYYTRGNVIACVLGRDRLEAIRLGPVDRCRELFRLLQFQLSKFRLGAEYTRTFETSLRAATEAHLGELHAALVAPLAPALEGASRLVFVPHDFLHYLPFHALCADGRFLADDFAISYAPSASVYYLCNTKPATGTGPALVLGVPDRMAPRIREEVRAVAGALGDAQVFLGREATRARLREHGASARLLHLATHGLFRQDNPMFSSIRLGDAPVTLFDLYQLRLSCELVTLSGCGTGLNVVVGGDELLGLVRGLLYAGARSVLVTLWDVNDRSTASFMASFYRHLAVCPQKDEALRRAMRDLRQEWYHQYYWAPFVLVGAPNPA